ncbi:MAG: ferritin family protein [Lachnospiraceae bacterium]
MSNDYCRKACGNVPTTFAASLAYPPVCICGEDPRYARMMLDNVGGANSEMSAVSLYFYNHLITESCPELAGVFHGISIVEMHHLSIFGELTEKLGENPRLWSYKGNRRTYWTPGYNNYPMDLKPMLVNSLNGEKSAIQKYEQQICQIKDHCITDNLERIIADEKLHVCIFEELLEKYCS